MRCEGVATRVPSRSLINWEVVVDWGGGGGRGVTDEAGEAVMENRHRVQERYFDGWVGKMRMLIGQIEAAGDDHADGY